jgi:hypothetical protein
MQLYPVSFWFFPLIHYYFEEGYHIELNLQGSNQTLFISEGM